MQWYKQMIVLRCYHLFFLLMLLGIQCSPSMHSRTTKGEEDCSKYEIALGRCFATQDIMEFESCGDCFDEYMNFDETTCEMLSFSICAAVDFCWCDRCRDEYAAYFNCTYHNCSISCPETPAPCSHEWATFEYSLSEYGLFEDALMYAISFQCYRTMTVDTASCSTVNASVCDAITNCGGGGRTRDFAEAYYDCRGLRDDNGEVCKIDCVTNLTQWQNRSDQCERELDILNTCIDSELDEAQAFDCRFCFDNICCVRELSCQKLGLKFCLHLAECSCGKCQDALETYFHCVLQQATGGYCGFDNCSAVMPVPPVQENPWTCPGDKDAMIQCLRASLDESQAVGCIDCTNYYNMTINVSSCESLAASLCAGFLTCDSCGTVCQDELKSFLLCLWEANDYCRETPMECSQEISTPRPSSSSPPSQQEEPHGFCEQEESAAHDCFFSAEKMTVDEAEKCKTCLSSITTSFDQDEPFTQKFLCADLEENTCHSVAACGCDRCSSFMENFLNCVVNSTTSGQSGIDCAKQANETFIPSSSPISLRHDCGITNLFVVIGLLFAAHASAFVP